MIINLILVIIKWLFPRRDLCWRTNSFWEFWASDSPAHWLASSSAVSTTERWTAALTKLSAPAVKARSASTMAMHTAAAVTVVPTPVKDTTTARSTAPTTSTQIVMDWSWQNGWCSPFQLSYWSLSSWLPNAIKRTNCKCWLLIMSEGKTSSTLMRMSDTRPSNSRLSHMWETSTNRSPASTTEYDGLSFNYLSLLPTQI